MTKVIAIGIFLLLSASVSNASSYYVFVDPAGELIYQNLNTGEQTRTFEENITELMLGGHYAAFVTAMGELKYINLATGVIFSTGEVNAQLTGMNDKFLTFTNPFLEQKSVNLENGNVSLLNSGI